MKKLIAILFSMMLSLTVSAQYGHYVGGDISILPLYEEHNSGYLDAKGNKIPDLVKWFVEDCGWNSFRVRLFVEPKKKNGKGETDLCVCQDLEYVKALGKRIKDAGAKFVLDIHYSDTWADPSYQVLPASWASCTTSALKAQKVYSYTKETLETLNAAGATPDFVQVGNETTYGMVGIKVWPYDNSSSDWNGLCAVMQQGCKAVHEVCPRAKVIIHTERSGNADQTKYYYNKLKAANVEFDIIGLSYYPFYQGDLTALSQNLYSLAIAFPDKKVQIMETSYPFQYYPADKKYDTSSTWGASAGGQVSFTKALVAELAKHSNVDGLYWWQPEEAGNGDDSNWNTGGTGATVMTTWMTRGFWWCDQKTTGHWPVVSGGEMAATVLKGFLSNEPEPVPGDVNADGKVNKDDVSAIVSVICGDKTYAETADVDGNGKVDILDASCVIATICGK